MNHEHSKHCWNCIRDAAFERIYRPPRLLAIGNAVTVPAVAVKAVEAVAKKTKKPMESREGPV